SDTTTEFVIGDCVELIACCASGIFIVAVFAAIAFFLHSSSEPSKPPEPRRRVNYTHLILESLDRSIEPCDNFYKFVCSGWIRNHQKGYPSLIDALEADTLLDAMEALEAVPGAKAVRSISVGIRRGVSRRHAGTPGTLTANIFMEEKKDATMTDPRVPPDMSYISRRKTPARTLIDNSAVNKAASMYRICKDIVAQRRVEDAHFLNFLSAYTKFPKAEIVDVDTTVSSLVELSLMWKVHVLFVIDIFAHHNGGSMPTVSLAPNMELETWLQLRNTLDSGKRRDFIMSHLHSIMDVRSSDTDKLLESIIDADTKIITFLSGTDEDVTGPSYNDLPQIISGTTATTWLGSLNSRTQLYFNQTSTDNLKLVNKGYFHQVGKLLSRQKQSEQEQLSLFLGWHIVRQLAPLASYKPAEVLYHTERDFHQACFHRVLEVMPLTVIHPLLKLLPAQQLINITLTMVSDIRASLERIFRNVQWMDDSTRSAALDKLTAMRQVLLQPSFIKDNQDLDAYYSELMLYSDYFTTYMEAAKLATELKMEALADGESVDNYAFQPLQLNAFYERPLNAMFIPFGIIRPPFANENLSWPFNFAGLGAVVGHEIMHGFDTDGKDRDATGASVDWWTPKVKKAYSQKVQCLADAYKTDVDGMQENVADFASLPAVLGACRTRSSTAGAMENGLFNGFTREQQFFLNYCFKLCSRTTVGAVGYATDEDRCNVPLKHLADFKAAFQCQEWDAMNARDKCNFWDLFV
ncbi:unnamed protein product, partial [Ixodes hexagonus]